MTIVDLFSEVPREPPSNRAMRRSQSRGQCTRVLMLDDCRCAMCHRSADVAGPLVIGHLVSVYDGIRLGWAPQDLNSDHNLAAMCEDCNRELSARSVPAGRRALILERRRRRAG